MRTHASPAERPRPRAERCPSSQGLDRWELLKLVIDLRKDLKLSDRDIGVLRAHLTVLPQGPLRRGQLNMSFMEVSEILGRACGMDARRFRRGEARLEEAGLILRRLSANGRRFPERDADGRIVSAYGIDLAPLLARRDELEAMRRRQIEDALVRRWQKNALSARLSAFLRRGLELSAALQARLDQLRSELRNALRRATVETAELAGFTQRLQQLEAEAEAAAPCPAANSVLPDAPAADAGHTVRHIDPEQKDTNPSANSETADLPAAVPMGSSVVTAWRASSWLSDCFPDPPRSPRDMATMLLKFSGFLGMRAETARQALHHLGLTETIKALDHVAGQIDGIRNPDGYVAAIIARRTRGIGPGRCERAPHYRGNMTALAGPSASTLPR